MEETSPEGLLIHQQQFCLPQDLLSGKKLNSSLFNPFLPPPPPPRHIGHWLSGGHPSPSGQSWGWGELSWVWRGTECGFKSEVFLTGLGIGSLVPSCRAFLGALS